MPRNPFTDHPSSVGESYLQHMRVALGVWAWLAVAAIAVVVHAFLPFLFVNTGSAILTRLLSERDRRQARGRTIAGG